MAMQNIATCIVVMTLSMQLTLITIFTWLNTTATTTHVVKLDAATIQGKLLFKGGVYYTEASSVWLLFNNYNSIELSLTTLVC